MRTTDFAVTRSEYSWGWHPNSGFRPERTVVDLLVRNGFQLKAGISIAKTSKKVKIYF